MSLFRNLCLLAALSIASPRVALALDGAANPASSLAAHKAVYDITLAAVHSGSQIVNIRGQMTYEWKPSCDGWLTDHRFKLTYEYADAPSVKIVSDFSTYESFDGKSFDYTSRRQRNGETYEDLRGHATLGADGAGKATYMAPAKLSFDLVAGSLFPTPHTLALASHALAGSGKFFDASVFDGSDEDGPIEINSFIGAPVDALKVIEKNPNIDTSLLTGKAWRVRMAVFPQKSQDAESDYEMSMVFHENGIISDMSIDYDDFAVRQKLISLSAVPVDACQGQ